MMGHNISFKGVIWNIIPKLSLYPFLSGALLFFSVIKCVLDNLVDQPHFKLDIVSQLIELDFKNNKVVYWKGEIYSCIFQILVQSCT